MGHKAKALYFAAPGRVELREEEVAPGPGEVLVRSSLIGISHGTEMLAFRGELPPGLEADATLASLRGSLEYPLKYGYINVGVTDEGRRVFAFAPHQDLFAVPESELVQLPAGVSFEDAVFLASMETALGVVHDAAVRYGEDALVVGQGVVGLLAAELLVRSGAGRVITVEPHELRRRASARLGCITLSGGEAEAAARIRELTDGRGVDVAVEAGGSSPGFQLALDSLAFEGTLVAASWHGSRPVSLQLGTGFHRGRLRIRSSQVSRLDPCLQGRWSKQRRLDVALGLLEELHPSRYITHQLPLESGQEAFQLLAERPGETIQVVLKPEREAP
ncbi:MAG: zinc-binding alcohol dehydrogenase [Spirochaetales bacterium]|nr:zinc-binding alcohol dehydrogenase [Spirochaetales bacterium]